MSAPDPRWIAERLALLEQEDRAAARELQQLYPSTIDRLGRPWEELSAEEQAARRMLHEELVEATGS